MSGQFSPEPHGLDMSRPVTVVGLADSDSYLKWLAYTLDRLPDTWDVKIRSLVGSATPSPAQTAALLDGSSFTPDECLPVRLDELGEVLRAEKADVLLLATRGPAAWLVIEKVITPMEHRPVILTGLPGISIPAQRLGTVYRSGADLFVLHSLREIVAYEEIAADDPLQGRFALSTLPFSPPEHTEDGRREVIFAAQALVPFTRRERESIVEALADLASSRPDIDVVVKVRAAAGEAQTHAEQHAYPEIMDRLRETGRTLPPNLTVSGASMREHLARAVGLVTVSSTAAIEAIAADIPVLVLGDFGVNDEMINTVFIGSDVIGDLEQLRAGTFHVPAASWREHNYFHDPSQDDVVQRLEDLLEQRRRGDLPAPVSIVRRELPWYLRLQALAAAGTFAPGTPAASALDLLVRGMRGVRWRVRQRPGRGR